jgi:hypothetical protein
MKNLNILLNLLIKYKYPPFNLFWGSYTLHLKFFSILKLKQSQQKIKRNFRLNINCGSFLRKWRFTKTLDLNLKRIVPSKEVSYRQTLLGIEIAKRSSVLTFQFSHLLAIRGEMIREDLGAILWRHFFFLYLK